MAVATGVIPVAASILDVVLPRLVAAATKDRAVDATVVVVHVAARDVVSSIAFVAAEASVDVMPAVVSILAVALPHLVVVAIEARDVDATVDAVRDAIRAR